VVAIFQTLVDFVASPITIKDFSVVAVDTNALFLPCSRTFPRHMSPCERHPAMLRMPLQSFVYLFYGGFAGVEKHHTEVLIVQGPRSTEGRVTISILFESYALAFVELGNHP